jgi:RND family efflux transporter MFP subunit
MSGSQEQEQKHPAHAPLPPAARPVKHSTALIVAGVIVVLILLFVLLGIVPRMRQEKKLKQYTARSAAPTVVIVKPTKAAPTSEVVLPANIQSFIDAPIYARTSGYLKAWYFDIGSHVKQGDLLAVIEAPEVDKQLQQAKADLQTSMAQAHLAELTAARYLDLMKTNSVAQQDTDNAVQQAAAANSTVQSNEANVRRLEDLVSYERVYAPFSGVITQRNTDVGQLINAGNGGTPMLLFNLSKIDTMRVFIALPQPYSQDAKLGAATYLTVAEFPDKKFYGKIARTSNAIDVASRTLNVEIDIDNKDGQLLPGAYAQVHVPVTSSIETYLIPVSALLFRSEGLRIATLDGNKIKLVEITPGRDYGTQIEVINGVGADTQVITNPPDSSIDGEAVRVVQPQNNAPMAAGGAVPANANQNPQAGTMGGAGMTVPLQNPPSTRMTTGQRNGQGQQQGGGEQGNGKGGAPKVQQ